MIPCALIFNMIPYDSHTIPYDFHMGHSPSHGVTPWIPGDFYGLVELVTSHRDLGTVIVPINQEFE